MAKPNTVFVPQIAYLLQGVNYDMSLTQRVVQKNQFTQHPIEDPTRSFLMDHNRERPITMTLSVQVTSNPVSIKSLQGIWRAPLFLEALNRIKAEQAVSPTAFIPIFDGSRIYRNMAFESIDMRRDASNADKFEFSIGLHEFRFARRPRQTAARSQLQGSEGPLDRSGQRIVANSDRPIVEATQVRSSARTAPAPAMFTLDLQNVGAAI